MSVSIMYGMLSGKATLPLFLLPSQFGSDPVRKIFSLRGKFFPLRVDPILEWICQSEKQTGSHNIIAVSL